MRQREIRKTDTGTVILHWLLVGALTVSIATGLRIAADSSAGAWLSAFDAILPQTIVWTAHIPTAVVLVALAVAYATYIARAGLGRRIRPDRARLGGLLGRRRAFWGALNVILYWVLFATLLLQFVTGGLLYLGYGARVVDLHRFATWIILVYAVTHVGVHYAIGGVSQLLRIVQPTPLLPPPPRFDPMDLIGPPAEPGIEQRPPGKAGKTQASESRTRMRALPRPPLRTARHVRSEDPHDARQPRRRDVTLQAHPLAVAGTAAIVAAGFLLAADRGTRDTLEIRMIAADDRPTLDGDISDPIWRSARPVTVLTQQGANLDGTGASTVQIRAVHDGESAYFAFVWDDPTRSLKHLPLVKTKDGWLLLQEKYDRGDEDRFFEDKFAVLLTTADVLIPGDRTFHSGGAPLADKPVSFSGRGLHYTTGDVIADVWEWKATSGGRLGFADDDHFGPPAEPTKAQAAGRAPYKGGFAGDPGTVPYADNFERRPPGGYDRAITPLRLPKDWQATRAAMGAIDLDPDHGESEGAKWWMSEAESVPYAAEQDARIPVGAIIPGVIISGTYTGDRADIRSAARWAAGRWTLELARRLDTRSPYDVRIATGVYLRVAVFDHTESHHTRAVRPIRIEVETCGKCAQCLSTAKNSQLVAVNCFSTPH